MKLLRRLRYLLRQRREARELAEELDHHRALSEEAHHAAGLPKADAQAAARRLLGNATLAREDARQVWLAAWIESVFQDLRYAARSLAAQPGFTFMALLALVPGIGLNTSLFTAVNALFSNSWAVPDPDRVVHVYADHRKAGIGVQDLPFTAVRFLNEHGQAVEGVLASRRQDVQLGEAAGFPVTAAFVSDNYFDVLKVPLSVGRSFHATGDVPGAAGPVAVISHVLWRETYASDSAIVGRSIRLDGIPFTVVGIASESFPGTDLEDGTDVWAPLAAYALIRGNDPDSAALLTDPGRCCVTAAARLRPGASRAQAEAELNALYHNYEAEVSRTPAAGFTVSRAPADILLTGTAPLDHPQRRSQFAPVLAVLLAAFGSILLLACANVGNLLLARAAARQREIAVRTAIGAGRGRVIRQLLTESLLLAAIASGGAFLLAFVLPDLVLRFMGQTRPANIPLTPDTHVLVYAVGAAAVSALAFGLAPALRGTRAGIGEALKRRGAHASPRFPLRGALLAVQVAVSVALLISAGLLVRGLARARTLDPGFQTGGVTAIQITLPSGSYDPAREAAFYRDLLARLGAGGQPVAVSMLLPLGGRWESTGFGAQCEPGRIVTQRVSAQYFELLKIPFVAGGTFPAEARGRGSIVIDESLARLCWQGRNPLGQVVDVGGGGQAEVVGVVRDAQLGGIGQVRPTYFAPFVPDGGLVSGPAFLLLPSSLAPAAVAAVRDTEPRAATAAFGLDEQASQSLGDTEGVARLAGALGLLALLLATVGVYGVVSYSVEQRRREIGVRMALGAQPGQVVALVLRRNARAVLIGLAAGLAIAAGESVVLKSELYGLSPLDPLAYAGVLALLLVAGFAASVLPARRAARTDPVAALHHD